MQSSLSNTCSYAHWLGSQWRFITNWCSCHLFKCNVEDVALADQVKKWYELESYGTFKQADPRSSADKRVQKILGSTTIHDGSRYVVGMLGADDNIHLPDNFYASLIQFKSFEKRLEKDLNLKTQYASDIRSDVEKGYVVPVSPHNSKNRSDIEGMFMQVGLLESDQHSLRFLWREGPTSDVSVFQYTRHNFGAKDSPTCANYALRRTAVTNQNRYPDAAYAVLNNFYMDDYLGSVKNPESALMLSRSLVELLKLDGFNLTKFISNVPNLSSKLNPLRPALTTVRKLLPLRLTRKPHRMFSVSNGTTSPIRWL